MPHSCTVNKSANPRIKANAAWLVTRSYGQQGHATVRLDGKRKANLRCYSNGYRANDAPGRHGWCRVVVHGNKQQTRKLPCAYLDMVEFSDPLETATRIEALISLEFGGGDSGISG